MYIWNSNFIDATNTEDFDKYIFGDIYLNAIKTAVSGSKLIMSCGSDSNYLSCKFCTQSYMVKNLNKCTLAGST